MNDSLIDIILFVISFTIVLFYIFKRNESTREQKTATTSKTPKDIPITDDMQKEKMKEEEINKNDPFSIDMIENEIDSIDDAIDKVDEEQNTLIDVIDVAPTPSDVDDVSVPSLAFANKTEGENYSGVQESVHPLMQDFDLRKAILYSEIVEKKYF